MKRKSIYSNWFMVPALAIFAVFFLLPTLISLFFSLTVWNFDSFRFCGLDNYKTFFTVDLKSYLIQYLEKVRIW